VAKPINKLTVETLKHDEATRRNIPTAEYQSVLQKEQENPVRVAYERRNRDLDPQLVWRGKDEQDWSDLVVQAPPLYIQEKVHPKVLIDDLLRESKQRAPSGQPAQQLDLFADFNGIPEGADRTDFYQHDQNWSNRMILGDSLQVMASLAEQKGAARQGSVHLPGSAVRHQVQQQLPVEHDQPRRDRRQGRAHYPRAGAGESFSRYLA
jgi:adenine-specific DNA-methyltransferase